MNNLIKLIQFTPQPLIKLICEKKKIYMYMEKYLQNYKNSIQKILREINKQNNIMNIILIYSHLIIFIPIN